MAVSDLNITIAARFKEFDRSMKQIENRMRRSAETISGIADGMMMSITAPILAIGAASIKAAGDMQALELALETTMENAGYSTEQARVELEKLRQVALAPGIDLEQAIQGSIRLQSVGFSAEQARKTVQELANAVASTGGTAENLESVTRQFAQMSAKGNILNEDLTIIKENMPGLNKVMMDTFGVVTAEGLRKAGVSADEFITKITDGLTKTARVQGGIKNAVDNARVAIKEFLATIGSEINNVYDLNAIGKQIGETLGRAATIFKNLDSETKKSIISFALYAAAAGPVVKVLSFFYSGAAAAITGIRGIAAAFSNLGGFVGGLVTKFNALSTAMKFTYIGAAIAIVGALYIAFDKLNDSVNEALHTTRTLDGIEKRANETIGEQKVQVQTLIGVLNEENRTKDEKLAAIKRLNEISPEYFGNLRLENGQVQGLTTSYDAYIANILRAARAKAAEEKLIEIDRKKAEAQAELNRLQQEFQRKRPKISESTFGYQGNPLAEQQSIARQNDMLANAQRMISSLTQEEQAVRAVIQANIDLGTTTSQNNTKAKEGANEAIQSTTKTTTVASEYKKILQDLSKIQTTNAALNRTQAEGMEEYAKGLEKGIEKLVELGATANSKEIKDLQKLGANLMPDLPEAPMIQSGADRATFGPVASIDQGVVAGMKEIKTEAVDTTLKIDGLSTSFALLVANMGASEETMKALGQGAAQMANMAGEAFSGIAGSLVGLEGAYASVGVAALEAAAQMLRAGLAAAIGEGIKNSMIFSKNPLLGVAVAGIAVAGINAVFDRAMQSLNKRSKITKLAKGGLAYGETLAMVGDNPNAKSDPEVISPLSKLQSMISGVIMSDISRLQTSAMSSATLAQAAAMSNITGSGMQNINVTGKISGRDIKLVYERETNIINRYSR